MGCLFRLLTSAAVLTPAFLLLGCLGRAPAPSAGPAPCGASHDALAGLEGRGARGMAGEAAPRDFVEVEVFYGTDRARTGSCEPFAFYGAGRGSLAFGRVRVTVPRDHRLGTVESPSIWRLELSASPSRHVILRSVLPLGPDYFGNALGDAVRRSEQASAFVFVHGFNVTYEEAAQRTAQIAYDLRFPGVPIFFSWPSSGSITDYVRDRREAAASATSLATFLGELVAHVEAGELHVIAHSMGSEVVADAVHLLETSLPSTQPHFGELVLAAPDIDARRFRALHVAVLTDAANRVTLYASGRDRALRVARDLLRFPRVGDPSEGIPIHDRIETVDATDVDTSFVGHSYYGDNRSVVADLFHLIREHQPAGRRFGLEPVQTVQGTYWRFMR